MVIFSDIVSELPFIIQLDFFFAVDKSPNLK